ncbi:MAG: alpha/beta hydrolase [Candidatus Aenigmarchaeota archaeon]|nr:alpha/beta hydrolase [Candidatus Aenigmarchaeota archaeon]
MKKIFLLLLISLITLGCVQQQKAEAVSFTTGDGFAIHGNYYEGSEKGLILLHMLGSSKESWNGLVPALSKLNYTVLAVDMRGHGESVVQNGAKITWNDFSEDDFASMKKDVAAAKAFLESRGKTRFAVIGASIGANIALNYSAGDDDIRTVILLSPGFNYRGVDAQETIKNYTSPVLFITTEGDAYSADSSKYMYFYAPGKKALSLFNGNAHGTDMLTITNVDKVIVRWLFENFS